MSKKKKNEFEMICISVNKFITYYLYEYETIQNRRITNEVLIGFNKPNIYPIPIEVATSNLKLVYESKILLVKDYKNQIQAYINPYYYMLYKDNIKIIDTDSITLDYKEKILNEIKRLISDVENYENFNLGGKSYVKKYKRK